MSFIFVVDKYGSALWNCATARAKEMEAVVIAANSFSSPKSLFKWILRNKSSNVLFSWRQPLLDIANFPFTKNLLSSIYSQKKIFLLIPDYQGLKDDRKVAEKYLIDMCHGYYVTNFDLQQRYKESFPSKNWPKVLHDLPNFELIETILNIYPNKEEHLPKKVIWIGNSKWGKRQGYIDHKRLKTAIEPLKKIFSDHSNCFDLEVIDSSKKAITHFDALMKIRKSDFLLQTSVSEGSGIPILEALALKTICLSTPVGIASEIFHNENSLNLITSDPDEIHGRLHEIENHTFDLLLLNVYEKYINAATKDQFFLTDFQTPRIDKNLKFYPSIYLFWMLRYMKHKLFSLKA
jgi:glycosyltransferase involved in cell wall biosynthesis